MQQRKNGTRMSVALREASALRNGSTVTSPDDKEDSTYIDFSNAGLYLVALQMVSASVAVASLSATVNWISGESASAIRTFAVCTAAAIAALFRPARVGRVPGLTSVFNALRPCTGIYLLSLASGQLVHSCLALQSEMTTPAWRDYVFNVLQLPLVACGIWRALNPVSPKDKTVLVAGMTLLALALLPLPGQRGDGPLCVTPSLGQAGLRLLRALLFSLAYAFHVFSSAPHVLERGDATLSATRASAASIWVLGAHVLVMPIVLLQIGIVIYQRMSISSNGTSALADLEAEGPHGYDQDSAYQSVAVTSDGEDTAALEEGASAARRGAAVATNSSLFANLPLPTPSPPCGGGRPACELSAALSELSESSTVALDPCVSVGALSQSTSLARGGARGWRDVGPVVQPGAVSLMQQTAKQQPMTAARMAEIAASVASE